MKFLNHTVGQRGHGISSFIYMEGATQNSLGQFIWSFLPTDGNSGAVPARAWGVDESTLNGVDVSALFTDDVRHVKRTTNWPSKLQERADFLERMGHLKYTGDQVFFANPLCVGFSDKHAKLTVEALFKAEMQVYIHTMKDNGPALYQDGDDMADLYEAVRLMANAAHQSAYRKNKV